MRAETENNELLKENRELKRKVSEYESDNLGINLQSLEQVRTEMKMEMKTQMQEFKDKYQLQIQQLEKDKDKLIQQLINK
jgi:predicted phage-related endonuclease